MDIIRTSDRQIFKSCRRKWDYSSKMRLNYQPKSSPEPLEFGTAIHAALEVYYLPETWGLERPLVEQASLQRFREVCAEHKKNYLKVLGQEDMDVTIEADQFEAREILGTGMLENYFTWAPQVDDFTPLRVEAEFQVPIPGMDALYEGRVDLLLEDSKGKYWIMDHKTAKTFGNTDFLEMDEQCGSYIWALQKQLNLPIAGAIYNRLLKKAPTTPTRLVSGEFSQSKTQSVTYQGYKRALQEAGKYNEDYTDFLSFLKDRENKFFQRIQLHRSSVEIDNLENQIRLEAQDMLHDPSIYPNPGMFNCMGCSFRQPCLAKNEGNAAGENFILDEYYEKRENA